MIDSIRKSLGIDSMDDVELLVETFYQFGDKKRKKLAEEEEKRLEQKREEEREAGLPPQPVAQPKEVSKKPGDKKDANSKNAPPEVNTYEDIEDELIEDG